MREIKRQINNLYFERSGLSHDPQKLSAITNSNADIQQGFNICAFEFLGLTGFIARPSVRDSQIETARNCIWGIFNVDGPGAMYSQLMLPH